MRLFDLLDFHAREDPSVDFASQSDRGLTYAQAAVESHRLAHALIRNGIQQGDRVAVISASRVEDILLYFAAARAGVVLVPLNYRLAPPEWRYIINDAGATGFIASADRASAVDGIRSQLTAVRHFLALDDGPPGWQSLLEQAAKMPDASVECVVEPDDDVYQMYTSGTTGRPKGAVITHRALTVNMAQNAIHCQGAVGERSL